ncbi:MAG: glycosyltransferase [Chloroflexi bacterium]|nr:MAG: glycosyltransferase [Chloroflexota bacterium]
MVIDPDRDALLEGVDQSQAARLAKRISSIPIAVDTIKLQPINRKPGSTNIMTMGSLHYPPNADGIRWFLQEVFPLVQKQMPYVTLTVIGKSPPADFIEMANESNGAIEVTGFVDELTPYMERAALMVVPVRAGSGMRVRLLEAFARAMPAVTTTIGLEGITATHDKEILIADTPQTFADETIRVLQDENLQTRLAENGRFLAENKYDWQVALRQMDKVYAEAANTKVSTQ